MLSGALTSKETHPVIWLSLGAILSSKHTSTSQQSMQSVLPAHHKPCKCVPVELVTTSDGTSQNWLWLNLTSQMRNVCVLST